MNSVESESESTRQPNGTTNPYVAGEPDVSPRHVAGPSFLLPATGFLILIAAFGVLAFAAVLPSIVRPGSSDSLVAQVLFSLNLIAVSMLPFGIIAIAAHFAIARMRQTMEAGESCSRVGERD